MNSNRTYNNKWQNCDSSGCMGTHTYRFHHNYYNNNSNNYHDHRNNNNNRYSWIQLQPITTTTNSLSSKAPVQQNCQQPNNAYWM